MRQLNYVPQLVDEGGKQVFSGHVVINMPKYSARMLLLREMNFKVKDGELSASNEQLDSVIKLIEIAEKHVVEVDLVRSIDQVVFKSIDDLNYDKDGSMLINEIGNVILSGTKLGKQ